MEHDPLQPIIIANRRRHRRPKRRVRIMPWLWRAGLGAVLLAASGMLAARAFEPYSMRYRQKQETREMLRQLAEVKAQNRLLKLQIENLQTGIGLEPEARRMGYIRTGEIPLKVTFEAPKKPTE